MTVYTITRWADDDFDVDLDGTTVQGGMNGEDLRDFVDEHRDDRFYIGSGTTSFDYDGTVRQLRRRFGIFRRGDPD